jgi:serine/threonine-protein kinase
VKVLDFGIARLRQGGGARATQTGLMLDTPAFMAPEQALGRMAEVDARTDLWAVGATLFALVSGRTVHVAPTAQETLIHPATEPAPSLRALVPSAPPELVDVVDRALAFERESRWPTAAAMREAWVAASRGVVSEGADALSRALEGFRPGASEAPPPGARALETQLTGTAAVSAPIGVRPAGANARRLVIAALLGVGIVAALSLFWALAGGSAPEQASEGDVEQSPTERAVAAAPPSARPVVAIAPQEEVTVAARPSASEPAPRATAVRQPPRRSIEPKPEPSAAPAAPPPQAPPAKAINCNPPYTLSPDGLKIWKRGCL